MRYTFGILTPLMFLFAVAMFLADFRMVAVGFAIAGWGIYFLGKELLSNE